MNPVQIYGYYTPPGPPGPMPGEAYVKFLMAFKLPDGSVELTIRNDDGVMNRISMSIDEALKLSLALGAAKFSHEIVAARARQARREVGNE